MVVNKLVKLLALLLILLLVVENVNGNGNRLYRKEIKEREKERRNLKPKIYAENYDSKTITIELSETCLKKENKTAEEMLKEIIIEYPCLSEKEGNAIPIRHHGKLYRKYLNYSHNENNNDICLEEKEIEWKKYCIHDISHEIILELHSICSDDITNAIYYGTTKKNDAWTLDLLDGSTNNRFKRPNIGTNGIDDHNIDIWILDSGIYSSHNEFWNGQIIDEVNTKTFSGKHGTNAASIAGGKNYGTSKGFYIHDYMVCGNSASGCAFSDIEKALLKVIEHMKSTGRRSVINMSVGSSGANNYISTENYYDSLFQDVIDAGGIIVVSAGNSNQDACNWWFSYSDKVISVGAHDSNKNKASYSNYGPCVDIYAPGSYVPAANSISDPTVIGLISGTSFSSPMVAGLIVNLLYEDRTRTKDQILSILQSSTSRYPIGGCTSGYCYGYYYRCSILSTNEVEINNGTDIVVPGGDGCCKSTRLINRLIKYCGELSIDECSNDINSQYGCIVDTDCA